MSGSKTGNTVAWPAVAAYDLAMVPDELGQPLHDRATRGESLSPAERGWLDEWLATQDAAEERLLSNHSAEPSLMQLRVQVNAALDQVGAVTRSLQRVSSENDDLRREIAVLRQRLAASAQPA